MSPYYWLSICGVQHSEGQSSSEGKLGTGNQRIRNIPNNLQTEQNLIRLHILYAGWIKCSKNQELQRQFQIQVVVDREIICRIYELQGVWRVFIQSNVDYQHRTEEIRTSKSVFVHNESISNMYKGTVDQSIPSKLHPSFVPELTQLAKTIKEKESYRWPTCRLR